MQREQVGHRLSASVSTSKRAAGLVLCVAALFVQVALQASDVIDGIPYGAVESLDGSIGSEWEGSYARGASVRYQRTSCSCSTVYLPMTVYLLHDEERLYVGLRMWPGTSSVTWGRFRAVVVVDSGDSLPGNPSDNLLIVPAEDGRLLTDGLDYHYAWRSGSLLGGGALDERQDAQGAGAWHALSATYEFEISLPMQSGDLDDVSIVPGRSFGLIVGFDVLDRYGRLLYSGVAPALCVFVGP